MSRLVRRALFAACVALLASGACVPEDIIVAAQQDAGAIVVPLPPPESTPDAAVDAAPGDDEPPPRSCAQHEDCELDELCAKRECDSPRGVCQRRPLSCDDAGVSPVCGCNGITFFNDCLRQQSGVNLARQSECRFPRRCGGESQERCPADSYCARLYPPNTTVCSEDFPGVCWVLPAECDTDSPSTDRYRRCEDPSSACVDRCAAIRSEVPYVVALRCAE
ncbi:MAG: hypothetical protein ABW217_13725 [Polyangiaceae bacterium]